MKIVRFCAIVMACVAFASCSSNRGTLTYFTDIDAITQAIPVDNYELKIQPADELFISVNSAAPEATQDYNLPLFNPASNGALLSPGTSRQQTYIVNADGDIQFPVLGNIHVAGMTLQQLRDYLTEKISKDVESPIVRVELMNFYVNVVGEVRSPHRLRADSERFSVLDALAAAGDLTQYGERNNVLIIREENGQRTYARLDLNKAESLQSPYFFLKQNDYVYVEPSKVRQDNAEYNTVNAFKLQVVSTIVSALSVIASMIIALSVK